MGVERAADDTLLATVSRLQPGEACTKLGSAPEGLSDTEAAARLKKFGPNLVARERKATIPETKLKELYDALGITASPGGAYRAISSLMHLSSFARPAHIYIRPLLSIWTGAFPPSVLRTV